MKFEVTELFSKQLKKLSKRFNLIKKDLIYFIDEFEENHKRSISIKNNIFKIRVKNSNKHKGKSAGYRIYYYLKLKDEVLLLTIYDKSDLESINEDILFKMINEYQNKGN